MNSVFTRGSIRCPGCGDIGAASWVWYAMQDSIQYEYCSEGCSLIHSKQYKLFEDIWSYGRKKEIASVLKTVV